MSLYGCTALQALVIGGVLLSGCSVEELNCPKVHGKFQPLYVPVQSNCDPISPLYNVPLEAGESGVSMSTETSFNLSISTEVIMHECTLRMTQRVINNETHLMEQIIEGDSLSIDSKDKVTGLVEIHKIDANNQVRCSGMYDAILIQSQPLPPGGTMQ